MLIEIIKKQINELSTDLNERIIDIINKDIFIKYKDVDIIELCDDKKKYALDCMSSMLLLSHAEFENYIENIAFIIFNESEKVFVNNKIINYHFCSLFFWYIYQYYHQSKNIQLFNTYEVQKYAVKKYKETINKNHGITKDNIYKLFTPLGFNKDDLDKIISEDVIDALYALKSDRGLCGHNGIKIINDKLYDHNQQYIPNYISKREEIDNVRRLLKIFSEQIIRLAVKYSNNIELD